MQGSFYRFDVEVPETQGRRPASGVERTKGQKDKDQKDQNDEKDERT